MKVYEKVCAYMEANELPRHCVARKAGISPKTFDEILQGESTLYADDLRAICLALEVEPEVFIELSV